MTTPIERVTAVLIAGLILTAVLVGRYDRPLVIQATQPVLHMYDVGPLCIYTHAGIATVRKADVGLHDDAPCPWVPKK